MRHDSSPIDVGARSSHRLHDVGNFLLVFILRGILPRQTCYKQHRTSYLKSQISNCENSILAPDVLCLIISSFNITFIQIQLLKFSIFWGFGYFAWFYDVDHVILHADHVVKVVFLFLMRITPSIGFNWSLGDAWISIICNWWNNIPPIVYVWENPHVKI